ncbi:MAG: FAD:protein FMN transferase, partial [Streptococcus thermophilus]|nr:FAD:protein FMN transferase [Streptococcus thermophilus]
ISSLSVDGEIWTTRLFGPSLERIFQEVSSQPNLEAIIVDKDNHCFQTAGIYKIRLS